MCDDSFKDGTRNIFSLGILSAVVAAAQGGTRPDPHMKAVLDELAGLGPKPIESLSPSEARKQPTPADAVQALLRKRGISTGPGEMLAQHMKKAGLR